MSANKFILTAEQSFTMYPRLESKDGGGGLSTTVMVAKLCMLCHSIYFLLVKYGAAHRIVSNLYGQYVSWVASGMAEWILR
jgi:hypothetical protein